jgi:hypothetical protein
MASRRVVGFALDEHHDAELAHAALAMAVALRGGKDAIAGVIMHTDSETVAASVPGVPDRHRDGHARMLVPGAPRVS